MYCPGYCQKSKNNNNFTNKKKKYLFINEKNKGRGSETFGREEKEKWESKDN